MVDTDPRDRPEIEVTDDMIEAGVDALSGFYPSAGCDGCYVRDAVAAVLASALGKRETVRSIACEQPQCAVEHREI